MVRTSGHSVVARVRKLARPRDAVFFLLFAQVTFAHRPLEQRSESLSDSLGTISVISSAQMGRARPHDHKQLLSDTEVAAVNGHVNAFMKSYQDLTGTFNDMSLEWWLADGNQIGALRFGHNFAALDKGIMATDNDMDFMIKAGSSPEQWDQLAKQMMDRLTQSGLASSCTDNTDCRMKIRCWINGVNWPEGHADIHGYVVNEAENYASTFTGSGWPFGHWNDKAPYRGLITDDQGRLGRARFGTMDVNVAYDASQMATHWDREEYGPGMPLFPEVSLGLQGSMIHKWNTESADPFPVDTFSLTQNDKAHICQQQSILSEMGYTTFDYKSKCQPYLDKDEGSYLSEHVNISRARTKEEVLAGSVLGLNVPAW